MSAYFLLILALFFWLQCAVATHSGLVKAAKDNNIPNFPNENYFVAIAVFIYIIIFWPHIYIKTRI